MKKFLFYFGLIFLAAVMVSCGNDDDQVAAEDRVLGIWNIDRLLIDENFVELNECERRSTIQFFAAGTFRDVEYEGENPASCTSSTLEGDWNRLNTGIYELDYPEIEMVVEANIVGTELILQYTVEDEDIGEQEYVRIYRKN
ncbi:MAG TPA: fimbrillin family protein [Gillisia sp.]|nr:fimbrillin family protein [Gillisia sp.]